MLECSACASRVIRALGTETAVLRSRQRLLLTPHLVRRPASTDVATVHHGGEPYLNAAQIRHRTAEDKDAFVKFDLQPIVPKHGRANVEEKEKTLSEAELRAVRKELQYLPDPVKLAEHVRYTLRCEQPEKALALCRLASKDMNCVVSWNHVVDWYMKRSKVNEALKVYNEMKKRAQFPDSYTYVLLLRGLLGAQRQDKKTAVSQENVTKAVSLYHSMKSPTSRVEPSIIHTNAALQVCAFGHDMDAFWGIAGNIPEVGHGAADHRTYSIILHAIRHEAERNIQGQDGLAESIIRRNAANEGRRIWLEVVRKWRSGEIHVDEDLVCSMARVLLTSDRLQDWDDVLNLFRQTMNMERLLAPLESAERNTAHVPKRRTDDDGSELTVATSNVDEDGYRDTPAGQAFKRLNPVADSMPKSNKPPARPFVKPGNDSLSVLLEACGKMRSQKTGMAYWNLLTSEYGVQPDLQNLHSQILLLKSNRASARVAGLLKSQILEAKLQPKHLTFRLALEVCARDIKNPNVLDNATSIIDVMEQTLVEVDLETLHKYLDLAEGPDPDAAAASLVKALNRLDSILHSLRSRILYGTDGRVDQEANREYCLRALAFMRRVKGLMHRLIAHGLVPEESVSHWKARRAHLDAFVDRNYWSLKAKAKQDADGDEERDGVRPAYTEGRTARPAPVFPQHHSSHGSSFRRLESNGTGERRRQFHTRFADSPAD